MVKTQPNRRSLACDCLVEHATEGYAVYPAWQVSSTSRRGWSALMRASKHSVQRADDGIAKWSATGRSFGKYTELFPLPVMGVGTAFVESLPSYLNRLGAAHGLSAMALCLRTILPAMGEGY